MFWLDLARLILCDWYNSLLSYFRWIALLCAYREHFSFCNKHFIVLLIQLFEYILHGHCEFPIFLEFLCILKVRVVSFQIHTSYISLIHLEFNSFITFQYCPDFKQFIFFITIRVFEYDLERFFIRWLFCLQTLDTVSYL